MELTKSKLSNYILFSNKNLEKLCRSLINESANAVLLETYSDKVLMADTQTGALYTADYNFDGKVLTLESFDPIEIVEEENSFANAAREYFSADTYDTAALAEAFEDESDEQNTELSESVVNALAGKNSDVINYVELDGINEEIQDVANMPFFKNYEALISESPSSSIKYFNWVDPVRVSIINEDEDRTIITNANAKAEKLLKDPEFKKTFLEAVEDMMDGDYTVMEDLLSENPAFLAVKDTKLKEFVGLAVIGNKTLQESRKEIVEKINDVIAESEELSETRDLITEDEESSAEETDASLSTDDKDIDALKSALDKALDKITDEKLVSKINALKDALDTSKETGTTDVGTVKECVELLSF